MNTNEFIQKQWQVSPLGRLCRWLFRWRTLKWLSLSGLSLITLLALIVTLFNWRQKHNWLACQQALEAQGEVLDPAKLLPPPIPEGENFVMTPLLKPLLDYQRDTKTHRARWRDSNALARVQTINLSGFHSDGQANVKSYSPPRPDSWEKARELNWAEWQHYFQSNTNFPAPPQPQSPPQNILFALKKFDAELAELRLAASQRRGAQFPVHWEEPMMELLLPHLTTMKALVQVTTLRASAYLADGQGAEALADIQLSLRLAESLKSEPILISQLVRIAMFHITLGPVWHGLYNHSWNDAQLAELQSQIAQCDFLAAYSYAIRGERVFSLANFSSLTSDDFAGLSDSPQDAVWRRLLGRVPSGWINQNKVVLARHAQDIVLPIVDPQAHRVYADKAAEFYDSVARISRYYALVKLLLPAIERVAYKCAYVQTAADLATVACAVERHRLAQGGYPETLDALVPRFLSRIPKDVITGDPLRYRRTEDGRHQVRGVGWDGRDDQGKPFVKIKNPQRTDYETGDWIWQYAPLPLEEERNKR